MLLDVFERIDFPNEMTIEDIHLGSPNDDFFRVVSSVVGVENAVAHFQNCVFNDIRFDGMIYRSVRSAPSKAEAALIDKRFQAQVKRLVDAA
ncbi:hypothetical protein [Bradyrhizobium cosmicum]|uniref:hypothetical protein n=1 Tax=Bradyrhizobium cosmicum TaxID=1404864 RepID=UPI0028E2286C|nr:hypothetical protein [Bradyrhizobium cosmicum]